MNLKILCCVATTALTVCVNKASGETPKCSVSAFEQYVANKNHLFQKDNSKAVFFEPVNKTQFQIANIVIKGKGILIDTRGGDLYSSKYRYQKTKHAFVLERVIYNSRIERNGVYLHPAYDAKCTEVIGLTLRTDTDPYTGESGANISMNYRPVEKCWVKYREQSYGWEYCSKQNNNHTQVGARSSAFVRKVAGSMPNPPGL